MDKSSLTLGWLVGRQIAGQRRTQEKQPSAYLYNGVRLPALPEWDKVKYPYVAILQYVEGNSSVYIAQATASPLYTKTAQSLEGKTVFQLDFDQSTLLRSNIDEAGAWRSWMELPKAYFVGRLEYDGATENVLVWANHNVLNANGTLYLAASDPIPVYEPDEPEKQLIGYSYNGVVLPDINEVWTDELKQQYPYACMTTNSNNSVVNLHMSSEPVVYDGKLNGMLIRTAYVPKPRLFASWNENNNVWGEIAEPSTDYNIYSSNPLIWTNTDIVKSNGSVYLSASDPIPVYE